MAHPSDDSFQRAFAALQAGKIGDAEKGFKALLKAQPRHVGALNLLGIALVQQVKFAEAEQFVKRALAENKNSDATLYNYGIILKALNRPQEALQRFSEALAINPSQADSWNNRGAVFNELHRYQDAIADLEKAITINPNYAAVFCNKAISLAGLKSYDRALESFARALELEPNLAVAWSGRGGVLLMLRQYEAALAAYDKAVALQPDLAEGWLGRGNVLNELERYADAEASYDRALSLNASLAEAWLGRGNVLNETSRCEEASQAYERALAVKPDLAEAWLGRGNVFVKIHRHDEAAAAFERALTLNPDLAEAWLACGNNFILINNLDEAAAAYDKALTLQPELAKAWFGRGSLLFKRKLYAESSVAFDKALALKPDLKLAESSRLHAKQHLCDWSNFDRDVSHLLTAIRSKKIVSSPFVNLSLPIAAADQLQCAKNYAADLPSSAALWRGEAYTHERIRIAYVSSDLREHPVGRHVVEVFEQHDKSRFEVTAISLWPKHESATRSRIEAAADRFVDAHSLGDHQIADYLRRHEIDIAVDLNGFTEGGRPGVFAQRFAPIQVNYLGYAGTLGADYYDYIVVDRTVIPADHFQFYSEKVVWLPDSFMVTESRRQISEGISSRNVSGLPERGFVFCGFNAAYKLSPDIFAVWMKLLKSVSGSVLWLTDPGEVAKANLRNEAERAGVPAERLIFATRVESHADHLARQRLADLFLDTLPYNAHATAIDALWAGLPVLTCLGETFPGRVAASLLGAVGLPELITGSPAEYEALALKLARDPALLGALKGKLEHQRESFPLFDSRRFTRHLEAAYTGMVARHRSGAKPAPFAVEPVTQP